MGDDCLPLPSKQKRTARLQTLMLQLPTVLPPLNLARLVNENEVKQWKEQAEKMRKGEVYYFW